MDITTQINTYFAVAADATAIGEQVPNMTSGNTVTPYIDGRRYFRAIRTLLSSLGTGPNVANQFFYVSGWWLHLADGPGAFATTAPVGVGGVLTSPTTRSGDADPPFRLEDDRPGPYPLMSQLLAEKAAAGVDVRVMGWVNPILLIESVASQIPGFWNAVVCTLKSIEDLRSRIVGGAAPLSRRVCALTLGHVLGAIHLKLVIAHDGTKPWAFTGGIDFVSNRVADEMHPGGEYWHDMVAAVDGPAIQAMYDLYKNLWNEQLSRPVRRQMLSGSIIKNIEPMTPPVPDKTLPSTGTGKHHIQVARTLPQYHSSGVIPTPMIVASLVPLTFEPNGAFEVKVAWEKAISNATEYIYIEDQSFSSQDVMSWLNARIKAHASVKVILVTSGMADPADPPSSENFVEAVNNHLLPGLTTAQKARIGVFKRNGVFVHSKVTLIDDHWVFIGSANCMRRGLYTDGELSVATLDEADQLCKTVRVNLWGGHFGKTSGAQRTSLNSLTRALAVWDPAWGTSPPYTLPDTPPGALITKLALPLPAAPKSFDPDIYRFMDADSRDTI